ncbi:transcription-repair coupling factor [Candidatus Berkiella cookevillensis]|uniref:Transcription-repair-coupling factor n=1 Tax=Candidatus Berkiella cookevillensis TaxID=437022 RepID=A0A0Q9YP36_9GAMM|nr:transcription-repair coupling factor [Candidatus Berkiella cookevillensis]MCS5708992.1 transcription-repair coupling factor [Candidatus Berkiella cookevillensis]
MINADNYSLPLPRQMGDRLNWGNVIGAGLALSIAQACEQQELLLVITSSSQKAAALKRELKYFCKPNTVCFQFPDWEILPFDHFSPHQDIISDRLKTLYELPNLKTGIVIVPIMTLLHKIVPKQFVMANSFILKIGDHLDMTAAKSTWLSAGYTQVSQVMGHGEYAIRGSIIDIFPMGQHSPIRIDLFDNEIESIRFFDIDTQKSIERIDSLNCLPAKEYPLQEEDISRFRQNWRKKFDGDPTLCPVYENISQGTSIGGIEYYLPLFFEEIQSLFDYLPKHTTIVRSQDMDINLDHFLQDVDKRYEQYRHDIRRPILAPKDLFLQKNELYGYIKSFKQIVISETAHPQSKGQDINLDFASAPHIAILNQHDPLKPLQNFLAENKSNILFCAESPGRKESLINLLNKIDINPKVYEHWSDFARDKENFGITIASLDKSVCLPLQNLILLAEADIYGHQVMQRRRRKETYQDLDIQVRNLAELQMGHPIVHLQHGVGRYLGLINLSIGAQPSEYLTIEYADKAKLYVPVSSLEVISQYSGTQIENAPLHRLGTDTWEKSKQKAQKKINDVAAELLEIHAKRALKKGLSFNAPDQDYLAFANAFGFETTPDQQKAIDEVLQDMQSDNPMDRLVCGDVGFGKTEVALRAAFLAVMTHKQVVILVPTTLLAQQHYETFSDRFANWPVKIEVLSRFRSKKEQDLTIENLQSGKTDIVIGTHKLLNQSVPFHNLGLLIIDEEHRFGVKQKEKIKNFRSEVDILTLTATPIPRTLNMALSSVRDLSIIATPPLKRLSVKTFVREYNDILIQEAINRELMRGGQIYYLHNDVSTIENTAHHLKTLCPEARIIVAHGQMPERALERVMSDFYHQRFNVLVCTTIIETGIDIPTANTIIIERADKFGLAQLHQIRGRVGRSHHQAYAYCLTGAEKSLSKDAKKRLEALESLEELGSGFTLATHDLEIRGAGEILGEEQSGNLNEIGFNLYMELLEKTVKALKAGKTLSTESPLNNIEIDLQISALIPEDYLPDVHSRLILYKRISMCASKEALEEIQVEMIDRFGLLPTATQHLFKITALKIIAKEIGITKIEAGKSQGKIEFVEKPNINPDTIINLIRTQPQHYKLIGSQAFKLTFDMQTVEQRFQVVENLLTHLTNN